MKKVYLVKVEDYGWDEYDSVVVVANDEKEALDIVKENEFFHKDQGKITAELVDLTKSDVILTSFNAG